MAQFNDRDLGKLQLARSGQATVTGDDAVVPIDQDGLRPAKLHDTGSDLGNLGLRMRARIARVRQQRVDRPVFDLQVGRHGIEKPAKRCRRAGWKYSGGGNCLGWW